MTVPSGIYSRTTEREAPLKPMAPGTTRPWLLVGAVATAVWVALGSTALAVTAPYDSARVTSAVCCLELEHHWPVLSVWTGECQRAPVHERSPAQWEGARAKFVNAALRRSLRTARGGAVARPSLAHLCEMAEGNAPPSGLSVEALALYVRHALCQRELPRTAAQVADTEALSGLLEADPTHEDAFFDLVEAACAAVKAEWATDSGKTLLGQLLLSHRPLAEVAVLLCGNDCSHSGGADATDL